MPESVGERILSVLRQPFEVGDRMVGVGASLGVVAPDGSELGLTADSLLRRADAAMYAGKRRGKGMLVVYRPEISTRIPDPDLPALLTAALRHDSAWSGFEVHYQPIVRLSDRSVVAVEALARWATPTLGHVPPDVFVAAAERSGVVGDLDNLVLDRACRQLAADGAGDLAVHVNVSATRLGAPELEFSVRDALRRYGLAGDQLVLEITETSQVPDLAAAAKVVGRLRDLGVRLALDDFGTGYNTLAQLHELPVDIVKLDRRLTMANGDDRRVEALCRSVIAICHDLGMEVIGEGIETARQAATLARLGCHMGQGYLYGRSAPLEELDLATAR